MRCVDVNVLVDVSDAFLAAIALEHGATWVTSDHGFGRFPGLRTARPEV